MPTPIFGTPSLQQQPSNKRKRHSKSMHWLDRLQYGLVAVYSFLLVGFLSWGFTTLTTTSTTDQPPSSSSSLQQHHHQSLWSVRTNQDPATPTTTAGSSSSKCAQEYHRVTHSLVSQTGLTVDDLERSKLYKGIHQNRWMHNLIPKLLQRQVPLSIVVLGGSITLGHGVHPETLRYSNQLETWLNQYYPVVHKNQNHRTATTTKNSRTGHRVRNLGSHGADMCAMAKRLNLILPLHEDDPDASSPDLFILEFAVNDYQGQDYETHLDHKASIFFDGFQSLAFCAEVVVHRLLTDHPQATVLFLEFQTAIVTRKTAQFLHVGVAQHYGIPVLSYSEALFPQLYNLWDQLRPFQYSIPTKHSSSTNLRSTTTTGDTNLPTSIVQPYPHGCTTTCPRETINPQFRAGGCKSLCVFAQRSGYLHNCSHEQPSTVSSSSSTSPHQPSVHNDKHFQSLIFQPCYIPFFAHDAVHPSAVGHVIATHILADWIAEAAETACSNPSSSVATTTTTMSELIPSKSNVPAMVSSNNGRKIPPDIPWYSGWLVAGPTYHDQLLEQSNFDLVQDTYFIFGNHHPLISHNHSSGFALTSASMADRMGWKAINPMGGEYVTFDIRLPQQPHPGGYQVFLSVVRSYANVGTFTVRVTNKDETNQTISISSPQTHDLLWKPHISIPFDFQVTDCVHNENKNKKTKKKTDGSTGNPPLGVHEQQTSLVLLPSCLGNCQVTVWTNPQVTDRPGRNQVKIVSLSARKCAV